MMPLLARWSVCGAILFACHLPRCEEISWRSSGAGLAVTRLTNTGPVICSAVRIKLDYFKKDLSIVTTLADNLVVGTTTLTNQVAALPKEWGIPVAAMNADFFMMSGAAKGDPRGLHVWRGELVSVPTGPAAFWQDADGKLHGEPVKSRLTVAWPGGGTHLAGLNEQLGTNSMVLFTPRMGRLNEDRTTTNATRIATNQTSTSRRSANPPSDIPPGGPIRPRGGREWILERSGTGPWLPLRIGHNYHAKVIGTLDGFTNVPPGKMLLMLGSNLVAGLPRLTNGTPVMITVATEPDLTGVEHALGTGPMLVRAGKVYEVKARMSGQPHPRAAIGWNEKYLYLATVDGRQKDISLGLTLSEMAEFMVTLGCDEAINMDGGQSTTLMLNGKVINQPTKGRHDIANGLVVLRKHAPENDSEED